MTALPTVSAPRRAWVEAGLIVAFWASLFVLTIGQRAFDMRAPQGLAAGEVLLTGIEFALWLALTPGIFWLSRRYSVEWEVWPRHLLLHVAVAVAVAVLVHSILFQVFVTFVYEGERKFTYLQSLVSLRFLDELIIYLAVLAAGFARVYFLRYRERQAEAVLLRAQAAELQAQLAEARLQALRMQLNPHFLFNTLHAVSSLVERDPRGVRRMIARLSELLRYALDRTSAQEVSLQEELAFLDGYFEIQRIRFQGRLEVEQAVAPDVLDALVPNLILQPLVENAIKHGAGRVEGTGRVVLRAWREGEHLHLSVADNGPGLDAAAGDGAVAAGVGLRNTRERLERLYGPAQRLSLAPSATGGLAVQLTLPYHTGADLRVVEA